MLTALQGRPGLINPPRDEETLKRGSDSLLEAKLRDIVRQKQQANRAQSLDLSLVLTRIAEGTADTNVPVDAQEETSDVEEESPSSIAGGSSYNASSTLASPVNNNQGAGSRMSAPVLPFIGAQRPHATRMNSGLADDLIRGMKLNK